MKLQSTNRSTRSAGAACLLLAITLNACATLSHGTSQTISVVSDPPGARVSVDSQQVGQTPLKTIISRGGRHVVTVAYDTFPAVSVPLTRSVSGKVLLNLVWYGATAPIDFISGAAFRQGPETVNVKFDVPLDAAAVAWPRWNVFSGDLVRFRAGSESAAPLEARYVDLDSASMMIESSAGVTRVPRADIRTLQRADGRILSTGVLKGVIGGAIIGALTVAASNQGAGVVEFGAAPAIGALVGLVFSPALAPRRWVDVPRP